MSGDRSTSHELNPGWSSLVSAILAGWNVGLITTLVIAIGLGGLGSFAQWSGGTRFFLVIGISVAIGVLIGVITGRKLLTWFRRRTRFSGYVWSILLVIFSILSFPAPFSFVVT